MSTGPDYGVRVLHAYENKRRDRVIFPGALERDALLKRSLVARVPAPGSPEWDALPEATRADVTEQLRVLGRMPVAAQRGLLAALGRPRGNGPKKLRR